MIGSHSRCVATIYLAGFLQGSAFVLVPASASVLATAPYSFSASAYALLFLPQSGGAIIGAAAAGWVQRRLGVARLFRFGLIVNGLAMLLLVAAAQAGGPHAYALLLAATLLLGLGFGWTVTSVNRYAAQFFSGSAGVAITLLNAVIGAATALSPLLLRALAGHWNWGLWPLLLAAGFSIAAVPTLPEDRDGSGTAFWPTGVLPFVVLVLIYAICEGTFGSWASVYVSVDKHLGDRTGATALSVFWGSMTLGRVAATLIQERWLSRRTQLCISAFGIASSFASLPWLSGRAQLIGAFALAGAACSIYFPFLMAFGLERFRGQQTQVAGLLVAALMAGEGLGSYGSGLLQPSVHLSLIYFASAMWGVPLMIGAWIAGRPTAR